MTSTEVRRRCGLQGTIVRWCPACKRRNALSREIPDGARSIRRCLYCGEVVSASKRAQAARLAAFEAWQSARNGERIEVPAEARRPRITKTIRDRMGRLLPMEYRPGEIAEVLGVHRDTLYRGWLPAGAPHRVDEATGEIWIVGVELAAWLRALIARPGVRLGEGEAYCLRCQRAVAMLDPDEGEPCGAAWLVRGRCPQCGGMVARLTATNS